MLPLSPSLLRVLSLQSCLTWSLASPGLLASCSTLSLPLCHLGEQILSLAVLSILTTAPLGAVTIMGLGLKLLTKKKDEDDDNNMGSEHSDPDNDFMEMKNIYA